MMPEAKREFTHGPLYRAAQAVYGMLGATVCFLAGCVPFVVATAFTTTWPIIVVGGYSIGPAWVALLYAMRRYSQSRDLEPFRTFREGYRASWRQALLFWVPFSTLLVILAADVFVLGAVPALWRWPGAVLGVVALLWGSTTLMIISSFRFRLRDVMRLAVYALVRSPRWLVADAALLLVTGGIVYAWGDVAAGILAAPVALAAVLNARTVRERLRAEFTVEGRGESAGSVPQSAEGGAAERCSRSSP